MSRLGKAAAGLHEHQSRAGQLRRHPVDVAAQHRRQVRVDHGGVTARHQLEQRARLTRQRNLPEPELRGERGDRLFVLRMQVAVQAGDGQRVDAVVPGGAQLGTQRIQVGRA